MSDPVTPAPPVAARTYTAIRMGVIVVIAALAWAVYREIENAPGHCVQRSLSAYYYTPVRPVFVGALLVLGFAMVVMWGRTVVEDSALNLAGLLLMVVALNPTLDANYCVSTTDPKDPSKEVPDTVLINANAPTISRGIFSLLIVVTVLLVFLALAIRRARREGRASHDALTGYRRTWLAAAAAVVVYWLLFWDSNNWPIPPWETLNDTVNEGSWFYHQVHGWSANIAVALVFAAVVSAAREKLPRDPGPPEKWWRFWKWKVWTRAFWWRNPKHWKIWTDRWAWKYAACAFAMAVTALVLKGGDKIGLYSGWVDQHATFLVEAVLIFLIGVFWVIQTIDRKGERAPTY